MTASCLMPFTLGETFFFRLMGGSLVLGFLDTVDMPLRSTVWVSGRSNVSGTSSMLIGGRKKKKKTLEAFFPLNFHGLE